MNCSLDNAKTEVDCEFDLLWDGKRQDTVVIFAHGAGANMQSAFMQTLAQGLAKTGLCVVRFNFLYMQANAKDGKRRPPDRSPKLLAHFEAVIAHVRQLTHAKKIVLMGKSMGGRMAAIVAENMPVSGVICLGYPFIPLKGGEPRLAPIIGCQAPLLIVQGERDKFGGVAQVPHWPLPKTTLIHWLADGDHSFVPRKSSGTTEVANLEVAVNLCAKFIGELNA